MGGRGAGSGIRARGSGKAQLGQESGSFSSSAAREESGHGTGYGCCTTPSPSLRAARGHQWIGSGGTEGHRHGEGPQAELHKAGQDVPRLRTGTAACHGAKGITKVTKGTHSPLLRHEPSGHGSATSGLVPHLPPAPKHHPGGTEEPLCVRSPPRHPESTAGQSQHRDKAHLEAAGVPVVPRTFGLLLLLCGGKAGGESLQGSQGSHQPAKQLPSRMVLPAQPRHRCQPRHWTLVRPIAPPTQPGQPGATGLCHPPPCPRVTLGLGTPTLVLQGLQSLLGLVVQLLQVRGPRAGEEDVVGAFLARRVLHAQPLLGLALGSACGDRGVSSGGSHGCAPTDAPSSTGCGCSLRRVMMTADPQ